MDVLLRINLFLFLARLLKLMIILGVNIFYEKGIT